MQNVFLSIDPVVASFGFLFQYGPTPVKAVLFDEEASNAGGLEVGMQRRAVEGRIGFGLGRRGLVNNNRGRRKPKRRWRLGAWRAGHAMDRPYTTAFFERTMIQGMPIARRDDWQQLRVESLDIAQEDRNDLIASDDSQRAAWQKIMLNIGD